MANYKVLMDGNGSGFIRVVGMGDYVPWPMWNEKLQECEALRAERDALVAQLAQKEQTIAEMSELCLTVAEVNEIRAESARAGFVIGCEYAGDCFCSDHDKKWFEENHVSRIGVVSDENRKNW